MFFAVVLFGGTSLLQAQDTNAALSGTVMDASGAAVPGAKLILTNAATGFKSTYLSDKAGQFTFRNLTPGTYNLETSAAGFSSSVQKGLELSIDQTARADVQLTVGSTSQTVTVDSDTSLINYDNPTLEGGISPETLNDMPLTVAGAPRLRSASQPCRFVRLLRLSSTGRAQAGDRAGCRPWRARTAQRVRGVRSSPTFSTRSPRDYSRQ